MSARLGNTRQIAGQMEHMDSADNAQGETNMQSAHKTIKPKAAINNASGKAGQNPASNKTGNILKSIRAILLMLVMMVWAGNAWAGASTTTLSTNSNPSAAGQSVNLKATVTGTSPSNSVTFYDGATALATVPLTVQGSGSFARLTTTFATAGAHNLTAVYSGDANNTGSTSPTVVQTVIQATSITALTSSTPNPSTTVQLVTLTATVTGASPTGMVTFYKYVGSTPTSLGSASVSAAGVATLNNVPFTTAGSYPLSASYAGDANNTASTTAFTNSPTQIVNPATTTTTLTPSPNPSAAGQSVALTATVTGASPTGTVTFYSGTLTLGTATVSGGTATLNYTFATAGNYTLSASYAGDTNNTASNSAAVSQTVKTVSTTALTSSLNPSTTVQPVTLTATVTGVSPTGSVIFYDNGVQVGTAQQLTAGITVSTATLSTTLATAGTHSLTVSYAGDANNTTSTSAAVAQTVNPAITTTTLSPLSPTTAGQPITLTATITGGAAPGNTVTFYNNVAGQPPASLGTANVTAGVATLNNVTFATVGSYSLTAVYSGDANNTTSTSAAVVQAVNKANTTTTLSPLSPTTAGQPITLTATITGGALPTGTVTFYDNGIALPGQQPVSLTAGVASFSYTFNTTATHSITAVYAGDANNTTSTSAAVAQTVNPAVSTTTLTSNLNPSSANQPVTLTATVTGVLPTGTVTFYDNGIALPGQSVSLTAGVATLNNVIFATVGAHSLTAVYAGDANNATSTSAAVAQTVNPATAQVYYIHADHLDTPREITDANGTLVWQWDNVDPFGNNAANENPANQGTFSFNLRFPGQYFDKETNLNYNVNRDYDPSIGRYVESDPIGLRGGVNTYTYVLGNPLRWTDPKGLWGGPPVRGVTYPRGSMPLPPSAGTNEGAANLLDNVSNVIDPPSMGDASFYPPDRIERVCMKWSCPNTPGVCPANIVVSGPIMQSPDSKSPPCTCIEEKIVVTPINNQGVPR